MEINPVTTTATYDASDTASRIPIQTLTQDDFLQLVVAQLSQQDPMNPQADTEFIAQMANFSALEQSKAMQADVAALRTEQQLTQANGLIGRVVELATADGLVTSGTVSGVIVDAGVPLLVVNNGAYELSQVLSVAPAPTTPTP